MIDAEGFDWPCERHEYCVGAGLGHDLADLDVAWGNLKQELLAHWRDFVALYVVVLVIVIALTWAIV